MGFFIGPFWSFDNQPCQPAEFCISGLMKFLTYKSHTPYKVMLHGLAPGDQLERVKTLEKNMKIWAISR